MAVRNAPLTSSAPPSDGHAVHGYFVTNGANPITATTDTVESVTPHSTAGGENFYRVRLCEGIPLFSVLTCSLTDSIPSGSPLIFSYYLDGAVSTTDGAPEEGVEFDVIIYDLGGSSSNTIAPGYRINFSLVVDMAGARA